MLVKLINKDGSVTLPLPADINPQHEEYNVFQTQEGVILCIPVDTFNPTNECVSNKKHSSL